MKNFKDSRSPIWRRSLKRRQFLANLLFAGGALSLVGLRTSEAQSNPPESEDWTLPEDLTENVDEGWVLPGDLKDPVPPKKPPVDPQPPIMGRMRPPEPPPLRGKVAPPRPF